MELTSGKCASTFNFNCTLILSKFLISVLVVSSVLNYFVLGSNEIRVGSQGGYDIIIAIEEGTREPENVDQFVQNINETFQNTSALLYTATKTKFYINSVNLIVPYHWQLTVNPMPATEHSYEDADIRLSSNVDAPHVENPNVCGLPGRFIELPLRFFEQLDGFYGEPQKTILTAWASYRYGVHEEHGYLGDKKYPYFYKKPEESTWNASGCGDIKGDYLNLNDESSSCQLTDPYYPPGSNCRFVPDPEEGIQSATSSLMYLHWVDSVIEFCDNLSHNKDSPNKQNILCGYKSVDEVIIHSPDFKAVENPIPSLPERTSFTIRSASKLPLLYVLVDSGRFEIGPDVMTEILDNLKSLFLDREFNNVLATASTYFNNGSDTIVQREIKWTTIENDVVLFNSVIEKFRGGKIQGSFTIALEQVIRELRVRRHPDGAIILVLKHGVSSDSFAKTTYETDLLSILKEENIRVHAIEIQTNTINPKVHLKTLALESEGHHTTITPLFNIGATVRNAVYETVQKLIEMEVETSHEISSGTLFKGFIRQNETFSLPLHEANLPFGSIVKFTMTVNRELPYNDTSVKLISITNQPAEINFESLTYEWNESSNPTNRKIITYNMTTVKSGLSTPWNFDYDGCVEVDADMCTAFLVVSYDLEKETTASSNSVERAELISPLRKDLQVQVWTSVLTSTTTLTDVVDLEPNAFVNSVPFVVFAKITQKNSPVVGLSVKGRLHNYDDETSLDFVNLMDNGASSVDVTYQDGIYSGCIHSGVKNGSSYRLTVDIAGVKTDIENVDGYEHMDSAVHRIIPIDQLSLGCRSSIDSCAVTGLERNVAFSADYERIIKIQNYPLFIGRITDLDVEAKNDYKLLLRWTVPVFHSDLHDDQLNYEIKSSASADQLKTKDDFENADSHSLPIDFDCYTSDEICEMTLTMSNSDPIYFAIRLTVSTIDIETDPSNVVGVLPVQIEPPATTTTTTTIAPPTTEYITSKLPETTIPDDDSESSTSNSTTTKEPETSYWYESTEGIITLSVFGGGLLILGIATLIYCICSAKLNNRQRQRQRQRPTNELPYDSF